MPPIESNLVPSIVGPPVAFSNWMRWKDRTILADINYPGVYLLSHFDAEMPVLASALDERIAYIGETCDSLSTRLGQFNRAAFKGKAGHSGGLTYFGKCQERNGDLFVSVFPVLSLSGETASAFIRFVERKLIWDFVKIWGKDPDCNRK